MSDKKPLADYVRDTLDNVKDIDTFKDPATKKEFIEQLTKDAGDNYPKKSIETTVGTMLKQRIKNEGKNTNDFSKQTKKRYSSKLDLQVDTKKVDVQETDKGDKSLDDSIKNKKSMPGVQNPQLKNPEFTIDNTTYESFGTAVNSILSALIENLDDLSEKEKESFGACLRMGFGDMIENESNVRKLFALVGISGIYVNKIKKARKISKANKNKEELKDKTEIVSTPQKTEVNYPEPTKEELVITDKNNIEYLKQTDS